VVSSAEMGRAIITDGRTQKNYNGYNNIIFNTKQYIIITIIF